MVMTLARLWFGVPMSRIHMLEQGRGNCSEASIATSNIKSLETI
jgi:hypothetical protein